MFNKKDERKLTNASICIWGPFRDDNRGGIGIDWETVSAGCGRADYYLNGSALHCMNQSMKKDFLCNLFDYVVSNSKIVSDKNLESVEEFETIRLDFKSKSDIDKGSMRIRWTGDNKSGEVKFVAQDDDLICKSGRLDQKSLESLMHCLVEISELDIV